MITTILPLIVTTLVVLSVQFCYVYSEAIEDLPPPIPAAFVHLTVPEDAEVGKILTHIGSLSAKSEDVILYSIANDSGGNFYISPQGVLQLNSLLDWETVRSHYITIIARKAFFPFKSSQISVIVDVIDTRDTSPVFNQSLINISIPEDREVGAKVTNVSANSEDSFPLLYSIVGGWGETSFHINSDSGELTLAKPLKYNVRSFHRIIVRVFNGLLSADATVIITVEDKQLPLEFTLTKYVFHVSSQSTGQVIGYVMATDRDHDGCGENITYSTNSSIIQVDPTSGAVSINSSQTVSGTVSGTLMATDTSSSPHQSIFTTVDIVLSDTSPPSALTLESTTISRNSPVGTVLASDTGLNTSTTFTIHGGCGQFSFNHSSGDVITDTRPLIVGTYTMVIATKYEAIAASIMVTVPDEKSPPYFDEKEYKLSVVEDSPVNTVIYQFMATDIEGSTVVYSSTDIPSTLSLSSDGVLVVRENIDYESSMELTFTITATNDDSLTSQAVVVLEVHDVNDHSPVFVSSSNGMVLENQPQGTVAVLVTAMDEDSGMNGAVSYSLIGDDDDDLFYFDISPSGAIITRYPLDYEHIQTFALTVRASDNGLPRRHVDTPITVTVGNIPDTLPVFTDPYYPLMLQQTTAIGTPLITVHAVAIDNTSSIRYILNDTSQFVVDEYTGVLSSIADVPPELTNLSLVVVAVNGNYSASVPVLASVVSSVPCEVHPKLFVFSEFHVFLPAVVPLGDLWISSQHSAPAVLSLEPSRHRSEEYFMISGNTLMMLPTVTSGIHKLNISIDSSNSGRSYDEIEVRVALSTNTSIEHHVSFLLPNFDPDDLSAHILNTFLQALSTHITCSTNQLQVVSIQGTTRGTELAILVFESDLVTVMPKDQYIYEFIYHMELVQSFFQWPVVILDSYACRDMSCDYYQVCATSLVLYSSASTINAHSLSISTTTFDIKAFCECPSHGYNADCTQLIDYCDPNPCQFDGICRNVIGGYECECSAYTSGRNCTIPCPSTSCDLCTVTPCLHGAECSIELNGRQFCSGCLANGLGSRCEHRSSSFYGDGFVEYPYSPLKNKLVISLLFATVVPNGRLMYIGNFFNSDYLSVDLVSGSLTVTFQTNNSKFHRVLSSNSGVLTDGQWRNLTLKIEEKKITISINYCLPDDYDYLVLKDQETWCHSHIETTFGGIPFNTPLYFGGLPSLFVPMKAHPFDYYTGCLRDIYVDDTLIDFLSIDKVGTVMPDCPQTATEGSCTQGCNNCVKGLWNGTTCIDGMADSRSLNGSGYITLLPDNHNVNINRFQFQVRTHQEDIALSQINKDTHIHISRGSVIFSHTPNSITLIADAYVSDGYWHSVDLLITSTDTMMTIDNGRVEVIVHQSVNINTSEILVGGILESSETVIKGLDGCVQGFQVNDQQLIVSNEQSVGVIDECSSLIELCNASSCPPRTSFINDTWRECTCECVDSRIAMDGQCTDSCTLCDPVGTGRCKSPSFDCICKDGYGGKYCTISDFSICTKGFFFTKFSRCEPCKCDLRGVELDICDKDGVCSCADNTYSPSFGQDDTAVLGCQPCNCHPVGSISPSCDKSNGQCTCKEGVGGQHCDTCLPGYADLKENGCQVSSVIEGTFIVDNVFCYHDALSEVSQLLDSLNVLILSELKRFSLPSTHVIDIQVEENSNLTMMQYILSSYVSLNNTLLTAPTPQTLAAMMQTVVRSGHLGVYRLAPYSHTVTSSCSMNPCPVDTNCTNMPSTGAVVCSECPENTVLDGIICRPLESKDCVGIDSDLDGIADICDICPFYFNPDQEESECINIEGVCPNEVAMEILWTVSEPGFIDYKDCPSPLKGIATRLCNESAHWTEPDLTNCLTTFGEETQKTISLLSSNPPTNRADTTSVINYFLTLVISNKSPTVGDLRMYQTLLDTVLTLDTILPVRKDILSPLGAVIDDVISDSNGMLWPAVSDSGSSDILETVEKIGKLSAQSATETIDLQMDNIGMMIISESSFNGVSYDIDSIESGVSIPEGVVSTGFLGVSMVYLPTLVHTLPQPSLPNISVGAPVWSLNIASRNSTMMADAISTLDMPINITFPHTYPLVYVNMASVICATWDSESLEWIDDGCIPVLVTVNYTTCSCTHLSTFTLLQNLSVEVPPSPLTPEPTQGDSPSIISVALFGTSSVILAVCLVIFIILCKYQKEQPFSEIWIQLVLSIFIFFILFIVGLYLAHSESGIGCAIVGLLLAYFPLVSFTLFLIGGIAAIMKQKWLNNTVLKCIASGIAWVVPLLYTVVCGIILKFTSPSFSESLGYPEYCWMSFSYSFLFFPVPFLVVPSLIIFIAVLINYQCCLSEKRRPLKDLSSFAVHFIILLSLFLLLWVIVGGVVYVNTTLLTILHYSSSIIAMVLSIAVFVIALLKAGLGEYIKLKLHMSASIELEMRQASFNNSSISSRTPFRRRHSSLPSLPGEEEPEYHTISAVGNRRIPPALPDHHPMHSLQVDPPRQASVSLLHESGSDNDGEVERILQHTMEREEDDVMMQNEGYGVTVPPQLQITDIPNMSTSPMDVQQPPVSEREEEDSHWFKEDVTCSPIHLPFSPSSSTTATPLPLHRTLPNTTTTADEDAELDRLYQLARIGTRRPSDDTASAMYAEIRAPNKDDSSSMLPPPPPPYSSCNPWYTTPADSDINYSVTNKAMVMDSKDDELIGGANPSPPPPIPPRLPESPECPNMIGGSQLYAEIDSVQPLSQNHRRTSADGRHSSSFGNRSSSVSHENVRSRSTSATILPLNPRPGYPFGSLDRRSSQHQQPRMNSISNTGNHISHSQQHTLLRMNQNGSQTFQSLV